MTKIFAERLLLEGRFVTEQIVTIENGRIVSIGPGSAQEADRSAKVLTPGLFDKHNHGALGFEANHPDGEKCAAWLSLLAKQGVTNVLYTTSTCPAPASAAALAFCAEMMRQQSDGLLPGARIEGAHMEGPFINPVRCGAMSLRCIQPPTMEAFNANTAGHAGIVRAITIAPEVPGAAELSKELVKMGIRVQAGHTDATCEQAEQAFREDGFSGVTHFYNAARPLNQRDPGVLAAAMLEDGVSCEAICDFIHVAPKMLQLLIRAKGAEGVCMISDSVSTAGLPDGQYGDVTVKNGRNLTPSGGIAGAGDQMDKGVRGLLSLGYAPEDVFQMACANPADYLGLGDQLGRIRPGMRACLAAWNDSWECEWSMVDGALCEGCAGRA
ncbi:MAG: amidohydrolase family protein [Eubacteriales bacterium]|nr:amidohydrolase family protein [Eubacteriales bacterium]